MDAISQTTFSNAFHEMKMIKFWVKFYWRLFIMFQYINVGSGHILIFP